MLRIGVLRTKERRPKAAYASHKGEGRTEFAARADSTSLVPALIPEPTAVFARIGAPDQHAPLPVDADRLRAAPRRWRRLHLVAARAQSFDARLRQPARDRRRLAHEERARRVDRRLHVHGVIADAGDDLHASHGLVVRAHHAEREFTTPATEAERGD